MSKEILDFRSKRQNVLIINKLDILRPSKEFEEFRSNSSSKYETNLKYQITNPTPF